MGAGGGDDRSQSLAKRKEREVGVGAQSPAMREEAQPAGAEKKRKKVVVKRRLVPQQLIDYMIQNPHDPWNGYPEERLLKRSQNFREYYAREKAFHDKVSEYEQALIKQYHDNGFAEDNTEVSDNDDKN